MKQALDALETHAAIGVRADKAIAALQEAIEKAEKQEPDDLTIAYMSGFYDGKNKYAPRREWVGLTDEEIEAIGKDDKVLLAQFHTSVKAIDEMKDPTAQIMNLVIRQQGFNFAKAIEAKLRERNGM